MQKKKQKESIFPSLFPSKQIQAIGKLRKPLSEWQISLKHIKCMSYNANENKVTFDKKYSALFSLVIRHVSLRHV